MLLPWPAGPCSTRVSGKHEHPACLPCLREDLCLVLLISLFLGYLLRAYSFYSSDDFCYISLSRKEDSMEKKIILYWSLFPTAPTCLQPIKDFLPAGWASYASMQLVAIESTSCNRTVHTLLRMTEEINCSCCRFPWSYGPLQCFPSDLNKNIFNSHSQPLNLMAWLLGSDLQRGPKQSCRQEGSVDLASLTETPGPAVLFSLWFLLHLLVTWIFNSHIHCYLDPSGVHLFSTLSICHFIFHFSNFFWVPVSSV